MQYRKLFDSRYQECTRDDAPPPPEVTHLFSQLKRAANAAYDLGSTDPGVVSWSDNHGHEDYPDFDYELDQ
jgi:hypothetical protein